MISSRRKIEPTPTLRTAALAPIVRYFGGWADIADILSKNGISVRVARDPYEIIPLQAFLNIFEDAAEKAGDPVLGARLGRELNPADLGPTGLLLLQSSTLRRGLMRFHRSISALQGATDMNLIDLGTGFAFTYRIRSPRIVAKPQDVEFSLSGLCHLIQVSFDRKWRPREVHMAHGPSRRPDLLEDLFHAPVRFSQSSNCLIFDNDGIDMQHRIEDTALISVIERHVDDLVLTQDPGASVSAQVEAVVSSLLGLRPITLRTVAQELGFAPRSLQRYLAAEGTSVRQILKSHRKTVARAHLDDPSASLKAVSQALGYADSTVFWRAYRSWTGRAPSQDLLAPEE